MPLGGEILIGGFAAMFDTGNYVILKTSEGAKLA